MINPVLSYGGNYCISNLGKNALHNISMNYKTISFDQNQDIPSVMTDKTPALEGKTSSEIIANNLNTMHVKALLYQK